jgi:phosphatidylglycerophosphatase A
MPGTVGSLLGLLVVYLLGTISVSAGIAISVGLTALSWWLIAIYEAQSHKHDDSQVVIDEVVGIMICFVGISITPLNLLAGFIVFRFLDIVKPFPIGWIDKKVPGAMGTLFDDVVAGVMGCLFLHLFIFQGWL